MSQVLKEGGHICGDYHQFGRQILVDIATAAIELIEREVIEVDNDTIEVEVN